MNLQQISKQLLPPGQYQTKEWPILSVGLDPEISKNNWNLTISGEVENPITWNFEEFIKLPVTEMSIDFHCVTTWSLLGTSWTGVKFSEILKIVRPNISAKYVLQKSGDEYGYTTGTEITNMNYNDVIIAFAHEGSDIPREHGGPVRLVNPHLYAYKSAKWLSEIKFLNKQELGFWEAKGYSEQADPMKEQRYTSDDI